MSGPRRTRAIAVLLALGVATAARGEGTASAQAARGEATVSAEAAEDSRLLVATAAAVARGRLEKEGDFHPFAFYMAADGRVQRISPREDAPLPSPDEVLAALARTFRERADAGDCRAVAVVADVVISLPDGGRSDALQVGIEHREGYCENFFQPYERSEDGSIRFLETLSSPRRGVVFPDCRP